MLVWYSQKKENGGREELCWIMSQHMMNKPL